EAGRRGEVEAAGEGGDIRQRSGSKRRDAPRVHAPAQVGADGDVAHELTFDGLAEQPIELLEVFLVRSFVVRLPQVEVPVLAEPGITALFDREHVSRRQEVYAVEERPAREDVLESEVLEQVRPTQLDAERGMA